jgi:hypothetical protein
VAGLGTGVSDAELGEGEVESGLGLVSAVGEDTLQRASGGPIRGQQHLAQKASGNHRAECGDDLGRAEKAADPIATVNGAPFRVLLPPVPPRLSAPAKQGMKRLQLAPPSGGAHSRAGVQPGDEGRLP